MAIKDCIKLIGEVTDEQVTLLEQYIAEGLSDKEAVRRLLVETNVDILNLADYVRQQGGVIRPAADGLAEIVDLQNSRLTKLIERREALEEDIARLNDEYREMNEQSVAFDQVLSENNPMFQPVENMEESEVLFRISRIMVDTNRRKALERGALGLQGNTPKQVLASWKAHKQAKIDNRKEHHKLARKWQQTKADINQIITGMPPTEYFQDDDFLETIEAHAGSDEARMARMFGASMYGDMKKMGAVTVKELFQNAYDTVMAAVERGEIEQGRIDVMVSDDKRTVTVKDNGRGMDEDIILNAFLIQGGTRKESKHPAGGFGLAKMLFLFGNKELKLVTIRDGIKYTMETTGTDVMASTRRDSGVSLKIHREKTTEPSGSTVTVTIADEFVDIKDDEKIKPVTELNYEAVTGTTHNQLLNDKIDVFRDGTQVYSSGSKFKKDDWFSVGRVKFVWGTADIYINKERRWQFDTNTVVSVEGLKQFEMAVTENPLAGRSDLIDRQFIIDIHPDVEPIDPKYPFVHNRQGLKEAAANDILQIKGLLSQFHNADKTMETAKGYGTLRTITKDMDEQVAQTDLFGKYLVSEAIDIMPDITEEQRRKGFEARAGDEVEVIDGVLYINGEEQAELTAQDFETSRFDIKEAKIDQSRIPNKEPLLHNYQSFKEESQLSQLDSDWVDYAGKDLIDVLYEKFGHERVNEYFAELGQRFISVRDLLAVKGNKDRFSGLDKIGTGVSVLGKQYYGVHTKVPGQMMFINPGADPRGGKIDENLPAAKQAQIIATSMITTMVHESAHYDAFNHSSEFIFSLQDAFSTLLQETEFVQGLTSSLTKTIFKNRDIYDFIQKATDESAVEITGADLTDLGTDFAADELGAVHPTTKRKGAGPGELRTLPGGERGAEGARAKPDDRAIQRGHREGQIVVPEGALHPEAGQDTDEFFQGRKGSTIFEGPDNARRAYINLFEKADPSTFIHESGHLYLELMGMLANELDASEQIIKDYQAILNALGVEDRSQIERKHHEMFATMWEQYTYEGKAPTTALQDAFNAYKEWLQVIYKSVARIRGVELSDDIRDVFDRMIATDEEIKLSEQRQEFAALFSSAEQMGVSQEAFDVYKRSIARAHHDAADEQYRKMMAQRKKDRDSWERIYKDIVEQEVRDEVNENKTYRAIHLLTRGKQPNGEPTRISPFKLDRDSLIDRYGKSFLKRLPHTGPYGIYRKEGGIDPDIAAARLGFKDADQMIQAILSAPAMEDYVAAEVLRRMRERFPDPLLDGSLAEGAVQEIHSEKRADILAAEMRQLRKLMREDRPIVRATEKAIERERRQEREANKATLPKRAEVAVIKQMAIDSINGKRIRDINPNTYLNAERKAGRLAFEAAAKGDFQSAYKYKRQQLVNHEMYRAAVKAKERAGQTRNYLNKFSSKRVQRQLARSEGVFEKIMLILESVDLRKISLKKLDTIKLTKELKDAVDNLEIVLPRGILEAILDDRTNWQELTFGQFEAMRDLIKQLEKQAKADVEAIRNGEKVNLDTAANSIAKQIYDFHKEKKIPRGEKLRRTKAREMLKSGVSAWLRASSIARILDKDLFGPVTRNIIVPMRRAYAEKLIPGLHKAMKDTSDIYAKHFSYHDMRLMHKKTIRIHSMDETVSHADILCMALNWGNEGNRRAVLGGITRDGSVAWTQQNVDEILSHLTAKDAAFVQDMWDYLDSYWPELREAELRRRGVAPKKIEATPFTIRTKDGAEVTLRGGYYPLKYSIEHSDAVKIDEYEDHMKKMASSFHIATSTRAGSTYERTRQKGRVVRMSLNVIDNHLREIIRDIAIGDEVNYLKRLLAKKEVRDAFHRTDNKELLSALDLWLTDAAVGELPAESAWELTASWIRTGFTKAKLGWNLMTMALQFTGFAQSAAMIGTKSMAVGLGRFMQNPQVQWKFAKEQSKFLQTRYDLAAWDKDVQDAKAHLDSVFGPVPTRSRVYYNRIAHTFFIPIAKAQQVVDITTWLGAYEKGIAEKNLSEQDAILFADSMVEGAQTSGFFSDRSGLERGSLGQKKNRQSQFIRIWTTLISYMLAKGNIAYEKTKNTNFRSPTEVALYVSDLILLFTVEGMASALLYGQLPEDDEPEDIAKWIALHTAESVFAGIPLVRDVPGARFKGGTTPLGVFTNDMWQFLLQSGEFEADRAWRKAFYNVSGTAFHIPSSQLGRTLEAVWFEDDAEWWEYISGVRRDD